MRYLRASIMALLLLSLILAAFLGGCGPRQPFPTPTPTRTPKPLVTPAPPPTPEPTPTLIPTPGLEPGRCPLTGERLDDPSKALRRPLMVKIGNDTRSRPQFGLHRADIVVEHIAEGGITRLDAVYLCQDFEKIGPVRSARLIDIPLAYLFDGILAHAGASGGVLWWLEFQTTFPRLNECAVPERGKYGDPGFVRGPQEGWPYNTFTSTSALWQVAEERGWQQPMNVPPLPFGDLAPTASKEEVIQVTIPYYDNQVNWRWDAQGKRYLRFINGVPHTEASTGEQIGAANVIIIWAEHKTTDIIEDENKQLSLEIILNRDPAIQGLGQAVVLRDGYYIPAHWLWMGTGHQLVLLDEGGTLLPLEVGNSWIEVVPLGLEIETG